MKKFFATFLVIFIFVLFAGYITVKNLANEVLEVKTPTLLGIDLNEDKRIDNDERICVDNLESFSLTFDDSFMEKYSKKFKLSRIDLISLGYLADEFAQKELQNKFVSVKFTPKITKDCSFANIYINGANYADIIRNSGFGIYNEKIGNEKKFKQHLKTARKLHLVLLNHHSNKYHTLDCKYGKLARDAVILPLKQLPLTAKPCKFCHNIIKKHKYKKYKKPQETPIIPAPPTIISEGNVSLFITNFTKHLVPRKDCTSSVCKEFLKLVNNSNSTIDLALYGYDDIPAITQALKNAKSRGVRIRYVYDESINPAQTYYKDNYIITELSETYRSDKTASKVQTNYLMHNKFVIFDEKIVYTGSMNFSRTGMSEYDQNDVVVLNSKEIANLYKLEFEQMLNGNFHKKKVKHNTPNYFKINDSTVEIYFSPQYKSSDRIVQLINSAKKYIYIPTFLITHTNIANALISAHKRGIDIKIIIDANNVNIRNTKHSFLKSAGIPIKVENYAGKMHSKTMIIDDTYLIIGSMNFSNSGENKNDENLLVITNSKFTQSYKNYFNYLWKVIPDKYLRFYPKAESLDSIGSCFDGIDNNFNGKIDKDEDTCHPKKKTPPNKK